MPGDCRSRQFTVLAGVLFLMVCSSSPGGPAEQSRGRLPASLSQSFPVPRPQDRDSARLSRYIRPIGGRQNSDRDGLIVCVRQPLLRFPSSTVVMSVTRRFFLKLAVLCTWWRVRCRRQPLRSPLRLRNRSALSSLILTPSPSANGGRSPSPRGPIRRPP